MIDERDRTISVALRPLRDELPPADWGGVLALAQAPAAPEEGAWVDGAVPVAGERPRRRSVLIGALVVGAALALAVVVAGLQGIRSPRPGTSGPATTTPAPAKTDPRAAFSQIFARPPSTDPKVLELTTSFAERLPSGSVDADAPREMPSDLGSPLYMVAGSREVCFLGRSTGAGCTRLRDAADPATPSLWLGNAADDTLVMVALVPDTVARMTVLTADQQTVGLKVAGNVATGRLSDRPARVLTTLRDGTTRRYDYDLTFPPDETLPPTKAMPRSGDRSRAFVRNNAALIAATGPAVVANGVVELPKSAQEKIADLDQQLGECLGRSQPADHLPTDPEGTLAKACPAEMAAIDAYAASRELNAAGIVRFLTADALEQCGRLGRPAEGSPPPSDGAPAVTPAAERSCREAVIGHLPPF
jgi:hypothetical protein